MGPLGQFDGLVLPVSVPSGCVLALLLESRVRTPSGPQGGPGSMDAPISDAMGGVLVMDQLQLQKMKTGKGFIAALDQSGGSTPKALSLYGIPPERYSNDDEMFELMHAMRTRIITSPAFNGDRVIAAILFEKTMDSRIDGRQ